VGQQVGAIGRWQTRGSDDGHEEGGIQRNTLDAKYSGGVSIRDWRRVKSQFLESLLTPARVLFIFISFFYL
jgi:hypothetical protein